MKTSSSYPRIAKSENPRVGFSQKITYISCMGYDKFVNGLVHDKMRHIRGELTAHKPDEFYPKTNWYQE